MEKVKQKVIKNYCTIQNYGSRTIAPEENCPLNPKTNPKPNPNPNRGQFFLGAIVWLTPNPTTNPDLNPNSNPNRGAIVWIPKIIYFLFYEEIELTDINLLIQCRRSPPKVIL